MQQISGEIDVSVSERLWNENEFLEFLVYVFPIQNKKEEVEVTYLFGILVSKDKFLFAGGYTTTFLG